MRAFAMVVTLLALVRAAHAAPPRRTVADPPTPLESAMGWAAGRAVDALFDDFQRRTDVGLQLGFITGASTQGVGTAVEGDLVVGVYERGAPFFARVRCEVQLGFLHRFDDGGSQARLGAALGLGPVALGAAAFVDSDASGMDSSWGLGPELRVRHRFGPPFRMSPSIGAFARADVFAMHRDTHPDRASVGLFAMVDFL
jgi:hypothetical protein